MRDFHTASNRRPRNDEAFPDDLPQRIARRLQSAPPGRRWQERMAPEICYGRHFGPPQANARRAAVMMLLYQDQAEWRLPLTVRAPHLSDHAGQISLPGGAMHDDESPQEAARRELEEELAVPMQDVRLIGALSTIYLFVSNFVVTPLVGFVENRPDFQPDPNEVARLIETPLTELTNSDNEGTEIRKLGSGEDAPRYATKYIAIHGDHVWGATAVLLGEFIRVLEEVRCSEDDLSC